MNPMTLLNTALKIVSYAIPVLGAMIERQKGKVSENKITAALHILKDADALMASYELAMADDDINPAEMKVLVGRMTDLVAAVREAVT